jgi:hypothetical protein
MKAVQTMTDLEKLCSRVTEAADCAVITDDVNRRYFTAMKSSAGTLVVFPEKAYFIIDFIINFYNFCLNINLSFFFF